jgi:hypothetical protein
MMISEEKAPPVEIATAGGETWRLEAELLAAPDLYRVVFPEPAVVEEILLMPCPEQAESCGIDALTLFDSRDDTFQPLVVAPYRLIFSGDVKIYENLEAQPRAFMVHDWLWTPDTAAAIEVMRSDEFDPRRTAVVGGEGDAPPFSGRSTVEIVSYEPERVVLRASGDAAALLVLTDAYYPGWEVAIDGTAGEIQQVNGLFRGVFLPAGEHEIVFEFRPASFRIGSIISLLGLGLIIVAVVLVSRGKRTAR